MCIKLKNFFQRLKHSLCGEPPKPTELDNIESGVFVENFIRDTIVQICSGVATAREDLTKKDDKGQINLIKEEEFKKDNIPTQMIEFDISLNTTSAKKSNGKVEVKTVVNLGREHSHNNENLSRVKFSVPITLPVTILNKSINK